MNTGLLTVSGFGANTVNGLQTGVFLNGTQVLDMTTCPTNNVNLIIDPATQIAGAITAYGYLTCASSPSLPYSACTNDAQATGGVIVGIKTPPALPASGGSVTAATFTLGCACIPSYVQGPTSAINSIGGVLVGATNVNISGSCGS
jgi:hypothetical protein